MSDEDRKADEMTEDERAERADSSPDDVEAHTTTTTTETTPDVEGHTTTTTTPGTTTTT
jgi:hypothetical protein